MSVLARPLYLVLLATAQFPIAALLPGQPQRIVRVPDRISCATCTIEITPKGSLEEAIDAGDLSSQVRSAVSLLNGDILMTQWSRTLGLPLRFDSAGHYRGRVSRTGSGPQEFRYVSRVLPFRSDSVLILDDVLTRVSVLTPGGVIARSVNDPILARSWDAVTFPDGQIAAGTEHMTSRTVDEALHIFSADLQLVRSFGSEQSSYAPDQRIALTRQVAASRDGTLWASHRTSYILEKWTREGTLLLKLERDAPWFGPLWAGMPTEPLVPPPALIQAIREDSAGFLWVFTTIPDKNWRSAYGSPRTTPMRNGRGGTMYPLERADRLTDTMIEVLDVRRGVVVARRRIDEVVTALYGRDMCVATGAGTDAETTVLLSLRLRGVPTQSR